MLSLLPRSPRRAAWPLRAEGREGARWEPAVQGAACLCAWVAGAGDRATLSPEENPEGWNSCPLIPALSPQQLCVRLLSPEQPGQVGLSAAALKEHRAQDGLRAQGPHGRIEDTGAD